MITIGIDLGTTNSIAAHHNGTSVDVIPLPDGSSILPSVVSMLEDGRVLVGKDALKVMREHREFTFQNVKRIIGVPWRDDVNLGSPQYTEAPDGSIGLRGPDGKVFTAQQISATVLLELRNAASAWFKDDVRGAVVTVPAYFDDNQKRATEEAARMAGFESISLLTEPEAAALDCGLTMEKMQRILVFDMGGGTFDVSIMQLGRGVAKTLETNGVRNLGGINFDNAIRDWLVEKYKEDHQFDLKQRPFSYMRLADAAEEAKLALSRYDVAQIKENFIVSDVSDGTPYHLDYSLTVDEFNELATDLVQQASNKLAESLADAGLDKREIHHIVLVGGMTRMPLVRDVVKAFFDGREPMPSVNPDLIVAKGAATYAAIQENRILGHASEGIVSLAYGIETTNGAFMPVLVKGTRFGAARSFQVTSQQDAQEALSIAVFQGEGVSVADTSLLGRYLVDIEPAPKGEPSAEVEFSTDKNGMLTVTVDGNPVQIRSLR